MSKKILCVATSNDVLGKEKTGLWLEELAAPYYKFKAAGFEVTMATPKGGVPPLDAKSLAGDFLTAEAKKFQGDEVAQKLFKNTLKLADIDAKTFDAVFYPGGHGPYGDLVESKASIALIEAIHKAGKPVGFVCHGPVALKGCKGPNGKDFLVKGKNVTGFSNTEEAASGLTAVVPFSLEDMLKANGANYKSGGDWGSHVVVDGNLVTGQNPGSSAAVGDALVKLLKK